MIRTPAENEARKLPAILKDLQNAPINSQGERIYSLRYLSRSGHAREMVWRIKPGIINLRNAARLIACIDSAEDREAMIDQENGSELEKIRFVVSSSWICSRVYMGEKNPLQLVAIIDPIRDGHDGRIGEYYCPIKRQYFTGWRKLH